MKLHPELQAAIDHGVHGHLVTLNADGSAQVTIVWLGRDGDEVLVAHLGDGKKIANIERDPRVVVSFTMDGANGIGLHNYAVLHGHGRLTDGGAPELLQQLAPRFLGEGVKFPPMDNPPAGRIVHITVDRVGGVGPWAV
ncbi:MAG: pyridoxamine 5'-phosphate oxidase family protein [Actinomycetia bacterium]|nr:pyridoxamine 5'-phosphate oxidase family protein [Actinomycetes bacterium]